MSFMDEDPFNHLDIRVESDMHYLECQSCGWDSKRAGVVFSNANQIQAPEINLWREHLRKAHAHVLKCSSELKVPGAVNPWKSNPWKCSLPLNHDGQHEYIVHW